MKRFAHLLAALDATTRTNEKVAAMSAYFADADPADAAWAVWFLKGERPRRLIPVRRLAAWAMEEAATPEWLFDTSYEAVGDLAETIALLLPEPAASSDTPLHVWVEQRLLPLAGAEDAAQQRAVVAAWRELDGWQRFVWNKLITGGFRIGVSRALVTRALARFSGVDEPAIAHRLTGGWEPSREAFLHLVGSDTQDTDLSRPYPFYLAYALDQDPALLGDASGWQVEWKWDGIRAQLVRRAGCTWLWSRGEELVTEAFPEIAEAAALLPDGVAIDGEILPWREDKPLPFAELQRRLGRRTVGAKLLKDVPAVLLAYDLLEHDGVDLRTRPLSERRVLLERVLRGGIAGRLLTSPPLAAGTWADVRALRDGARDARAEGLMLKRLDAQYGVGRRRGAWWKWKVEPLTVDAVMMYAQADHGKRASLHTDYTFGVWSEGELVPFAKAYTGLTDAEIRKLDAWIRRNTLEKFGPVRQVPAEHVFEIAFEGIQSSPRHRSGVAVRFPRILRWCTDRRPDDADTLDTLHALLKAAGAADATS
ncbi:MAG TPA: ATP-dependent DNA ligase [Longimicrobiales bacterium]|nr:ATP-dependent DNA ligase [Longimicrobiales bacterium]